MRKLNKGDAVLHRNGLVGIIFDIKDNWDTVAYPINYYGEYFYSIEWKEEPKSMAIHDWSRPDFECGLIKYLGPNTKMAKALYAKV